MFASSSASRRRRLAFDDAIANRTFSQRCEREALLNAFSGTTFHRARTPFATFARAFSRRN
jgi:hypothetical protein